MPCNSFTAFVHATGIWAVFTLATMRPDAAPIDESAWEAQAGSGTFASQLVLMRVAHQVAAAR